MNDQNQAKIEAVRNSWLTYQEDINLVKTINQVSNVVRWVKEHEMDARSVALGYNTEHFDEVFTGVTVSYPFRPHLISEATFTRKFAKREGKE